MNLFFILVLITFNLIVPNQPNEALALSNVEFLNKQELTELYQLLTNHINDYDAEAKLTRDNSKKTNWDEYVKYHKDHFISSQNWQELATAFKRFSQGFVNLHSKLSFNAGFDQVSQKTDTTIGYTYPDISFFVNDDTQQTISHINGMVIEEAFDVYEDLSCAYNSTIGCLHSFTKDFTSGLLQIDHHQVQNITIANKHKIINYTASEASDPMHKYLSPIDISTYQDWQLLAKGYKVAVLEKDHHLLIKIKDFIYTKGAGGGLRCKEKAVEKSMCYDIRKIREALNTIDATQHNLIIDVQNNGGGNENSPFLAELSLDTFEDLSVQYLNTDLLNNNTIRQRLFYGSKRAESWFKHTIKDLSLFKDMVFLPIRSDFCRGHERCAIEPIEPNSKRSFKQVVILTNHNCVSSCDDFVWRMQDSSDVKVMGLPNAADATYSRVSVVFYIDKNHNISTVYHDDGDESQHQSTALFKLTIPYSRTVDNNGHMRQGVAAHIDRLIPVTKNNFNQHDLSVLAEVLTSLD